MNQTEMKLGDIYRAGDVHRWQIVKTLKQQSVAEHSFHVAVIALALYDKMMEDYLLRQWRVASWGNAHDTAVLLRWALYHDVPEVLTGDVATPFKMLIRQNCGGDPFGKIEKMVGGRYRTALDAINQDSFLRHIVKVADLIESVRFLADNACNEHGNAIYARLRERVIGYPYDSIVFAGADSDYVDWFKFTFIAATQHIMKEIFSPPLMLDDIVDWKGVDHEEA